MQNRALEKILLINDRLVRSGAVNMAIDELLWRENDKIAAFCRVYGWRKIGFTCGYSQKSDLINAYQTEHSIPFLTRRITGGGIVVHGKNDITVSLGFARRHPFARLRPAELSLAVHACLTRVLAEVDGNEYQISKSQIKPQIKSKINSLIKSQVNSARDFCFDGIAFSDAHKVGSSQKILGSAQKRGREAILLQASLQEVEAKFKSAYIENIFKNMEEFFTRDFYKSKPKKITRLEITKNTNDTFYNDLLRRAKILTCKRYGTADWHFRL